MDLPGANVLLSPWVLAALGLCIGSFLNVVIHRLPLMMEREWWGEIARFLSDASAQKRAFGTTSGVAPEELARTGMSIDTALQSQPTLTLSRPRSRCPGCGHMITWRQNIPVFSWMYLKGRCSACATQISARYPVIELLTALLFVASSLKFGATPGALVYCTASALLVAMAFIDLDTQLLPDDLTFPLAGLGLLAAGMGWTGVSLQASAWGLLGGYFSLWAVSKLYTLVRKVQGMGEGDFKLLAGLGALMGWQVLPSIILLSSLVGAVVGIGLMVFRGHDRNIPIPFGPYLVGGGIAAMFFGPTLTRALWPMP
jgi:leader peptidase (prepilin peptidase)/N-methyltransferase